MAARCAVSINAMRAPDPAAFPAEVYPVKGHIGDHSQNQRVFGRNMRPKGAGQNNTIHFIHAELIHQEPCAGI